MKKIIIILAALVLSLPAALAQESHGIQDAQEQLDASTKNLNELQKEKSRYISDSEKIIREAKSELSRLKGRQSVIDQSIKSNKAELKARKKEFMKERLPELFRQMRLLDISIEDVANAWEKQ